MRNAQARENSSSRLAKVTLLGLLHQRSLTKSLNENKSGPYISDDLGYCKDRASASRSYKAWFLGLSGSGFRVQEFRSQGFGDPMFPNTTWLGNRQQDLVLIALFGNLRLRSVSCALVGVTTVGLEFRHPSDMRLKVLAWLISVRYVDVISSI